MIISHAASSLQVWGSNPSEGEIFQHIFLNFFTFFFKGGLISEGILNLVLSKKMCKITLDWKVEEIDLAHFLG